MKSLHIVRNPDDPLSRTAIQTSFNGEENAVLLMQDAVYGEFQFDPVKIYVCREDLLARNIDKGYQQVSYDEIAGMIIAYDRIIVW